MLSGCGSRERMPHARRNKKMPAQTALLAGISQRSERASNAKVEFEFHISRMFFVPLPDTLRSVLGLEFSRAFATL
jgi:hypothetical protein